MAADALNPEQQKLKADERRTEVSDLYLRGWTMRALAAKFDVSHVTIKRDLDAIAKAWKQSQIENHEQRVAAELERLALIEREAWDAFERSKLPFRSRETNLTAAGGKGKGSEQRRNSKLREEERDGGQSWLQTVLTVIAQRRQLLGLDAPEQRKLQMVVEAQADQVLDILRRVLPEEQYDAVTKALSEAASE